VNLCRFFFSESESVQVFLSGRGGDHIDQLPLTIRGRSRHFHISGGPFFYRKKSDFKTIYIKKNQKKPRRNSKRKLKKHSGNKNHVYEIGNILLKHVFTSL
jgi:hypothetical protein